MSIHQKIRDFRKAKGWTEQQFADACDVSRSTIRLWELDGGTAPNRKKQPDVARVMGITVAELMADDAVVGPLGATLPALAGGGCGPVSLDAAIAVLADAIERSPYKGQDNLLGMLAYMGKSPGDELNRQAIAALLQNKQQPDARPTKMAA